MKKKTFTPKQSGFTLIEVMIVISLIAVLSVTGILAFSSFSRTQVLNAASGDVVVLLNLAKSRAYSQVKPSIAICANNPLDGYEIRVCSSSCPGAPAGSDLGLYVRCGGQSAGISYTNFPELTVTSTANPYFYPVLKGGVSSPGDITIQNANGDIRQVSVNSSGLVSQ